MKALLILLAVIPTFSFAIEKCQKEVSQSQTLYYEINKIILSPHLTNGSPNLAFYKDLVAKNKFNEAKSEIENYQYATYDITTKKSSFFGIFYYSSAQNNYKIENKLVDHKNENLEGKKKELLDLLSQSVNSVTMENNNILIVQTQDGRSAAIDFRLPMSANPISFSTKDSSKFLASISSKNGIPFTPESNKTIVEAFEHNQYQVEECDEKVYTSVKTKEKTILGIPFTIKEYAHVDETKNTSR